MPVISFTAGQVLTAAQMNQIGQDSGWLSVAATLNSWTGTVYYRKVGTVVSLSGQISGGTANNLAVTLPSGYRPSSANATSFYYLGTDTANAVSGFLITSTGGITPRSTKAVNVDVARFYTD